MMRRGARCAKHDGGQPFSKDRKCLVGQENHEIFRISTNALLDGMRAGGNRIGIACDELSETI